VTRKELVVATVSEWYHWNNKSTTMWFINGMKKWLKERSDVGIPAFHGLPKLVYDTISVKSIVSDSDLLV